MFIFTALHRHDQTQKIYVLVKGVNIAKWKEADKKET